MKKLSVVISVIGLFTLFIIYSTSELNLIDASTIDETMIGKTVRTSSIIKSVKELDESMMIYTSEIRLHSQEKINLNSSINTKAYFSGRIDEDKYGLLIRLDKIEVIKK